jgi:transposase InsO family protein
MLLRNDLLHYAEDGGRTVRVLWIHPQSVGAAIIDVLDEKALPTIVRVDALIDDLKPNGRAQLLKPDPYFVLAIESALPEKHKAIRDRAWKMIDGLVSQEPDIYLPNKRGRLLKDVMKENRITLKTLYRYLRRYWQRGQTPNTLLPDYANSGGKGKARIPTQTKRGRPRIYGVSPGININADERRIFSVAISRYYAQKGSKFTLDGAYDEMIRTFFCERVVDPETGQVIHRRDVTSDQNGPPSRGQFRYWYEKEHDTLAIKRRRVGAKVYDKDMRGLLGTSAAETWGPGARFQIDATLADVYLVSRLKRDRIIGRPVLYVVIDVFSRMIVGIYVGLEGPSWVGAMMALANTAADKVAFCRRFGREIEMEDWPCHHLPAVLLGDRGEIEGHYVETLAKNYHVNIENAASFRADWKGVVEQRFRLLPAKFKPFVPGYIQCDFRQRGGRDYRLDAVLDLDQFTRIIIDCVLHYNNQHELEGYDKTQDMAADDVAPVAIEVGCQ